MYFLTGLEAGSTKSLSLGWNQGASKAVLPPKSLGENPFLASSSFWWPLGFLSLWLHHCNLYLCGHVVSFSSVCSQNFLLEGHFWLRLGLTCIVATVQPLSHVQLFGTPRTAARQTSLPFTIARSLLRLKSIELVMPSNHLILCHLDNPE